MKIYFVRHGESEANRLNEISNRGLKHGLTSRGREQSLVLADRFSQIDIRKLYTSPLLRAIQTAQVLSYASGIPYETTEALREYDCGVLEGQSDPDSWALYNQVYTAWIRDEDRERRIEGGESFLDIQRRFVPFVQRLIDTYGRLSVNIVTVGHGGLYRCMLPLVLQNINFEFAAAHPLDHSSYVLAQVEDGHARCLKWGETSLFGAG